MQAAEHAFGSIVRRISATKNFCFYGGAPRDFIAQYNFPGDLDICIVYNAFEDFYKKKFISANYTANHPTTKNILDKDGYKIGERFVDRIPFHYKGTDRIIDFVLWDKDPFDIALTVDFVCCALFINCNNDLYEAIPGAYEDCINKIARVNYKSKTLFSGSIREITSRFKDRSEKLESRGWKIIT